MTGEEIARCTPWELNARIAGYARRTKNDRIFTASLVTLPVINYSMRGPKEAITLPKLLPDDFALSVPDEESIKAFKKLKEETESKRKEGKHGRT